MIGYSLAKFMGDKLNLIGAMKEMKEKWRTVVCQFKTMVDSGEPIQVQKYYMGSLDQMVRDSVKNFSKRV